MKKYGSFLVLDTCTFAETNYFFIMDKIIVTQIEDIPAQIIIEAFKCLEQKIDNIADEAKRPKTLPSNYLTRGEVITLLKVSAVTVHDWTNKGFLKAYRLGNKVYYKQPEIDAAMIEIKKGGRNVQG